MEEVVRVEEKVEILGGLGEEETLHPVGEAVVPHVLDGGVATGRPGRVLYGPSGR